MTGWEIGLRVLACLWLVVVTFMVIRGARTGPPGLMGISGEPGPQGPPGPAGMAGPPPSREVLEALVEAALRDGLDRAKEAGRLCADGKDEMEDNDERAR